MLNLVWEIFFNPWSPNGSWMVIKSVILLIPLVGILKKNRRTFQWSSMIILLFFVEGVVRFYSCLLYTSPSPRDRTRSRMPSSA